MCLRKVPVTPLASVLKQADAGFHTGDMSVHCLPEIQAQLDRAAAEQGRNTESLIQEGWSVCSITTISLLARWKKACRPDRGECVEHDEIEKLINSRYSG